MSTTMVVESAHKSSMQLRQAPLSGATSCCDLFFRPGWLVATSKCYSFDWVTWIWTVRPSVHPLCLSTNRPTTTTIHCSEVDRHVIEIMKTISRYVFGIISICFGLFFLLFFFSISKCLFVIAWQFSAIKAFFPLTIIAFFTDHRIVDRLLFLER